MWWRLNGFGRVGGVELRRAGLRDALSAIETTGRDGLPELRRLLGLLTDPDTESAAGPQPSLERLEHFVEQVRNQRQGLR